MSDSSLQARKMHTNTKNKQHCYESSGHMCEGTRRSSEKKVITYYIMGACAPGAWYEVPLFEQVPRMALRPAHPARPRATRLPPLNIYFLPIKDLPGTPTDTLNSPKRWYHDLILTSLLRGD